jgi:hypothetical protein
LVVGLIVLRRLLLIVPLLIVVHALYRLRTRRDHRTITR